MAHEDRSTRTRRRAASRPAPEPVWLDPPGLRGYTWDPQSAYSARDSNRLLAIRIETNYDCNLRCRYCYAQGGKQNDQVPFERLADTVRQARDLGAQAVVVIGGGEPTLYHRFRDLIALINHLDLIPVVFSNLIALDAELAGFLYDHDASVMGKLDSLRPEVQDYLAGQSGASKRIRLGLDYLLDVGFAARPDQHHLRLGLSFVSCRLNFDEIDDIWRFCRTRGIFPNMEVLTPTGRARLQLPNAHLTTREVQDYKLHLLEIDRREFGYDWLPYTPLAASGCLQHFYSFYITLAGDVRPCAPTKFDEHPDLRDDHGLYPYNINRRSLADIYDSELFNYVRHIDSHLEGRCRACEHHDCCIGCRGFAYSVGINRGLDPRLALRSECLQCLK